MQEYIINNWFDVVTAIFAILGWIVALTPTQEDDAILGRIRNLWRIVVRR